MITTKFDPIGRDIELLFDAELSPPARSRILAQFAQEQFQAADDANTRAFGRRARSRRFVDGSEGTPLRGVRPDGTIVFEWDVVREAVVWIGALLAGESPVGRTRRYSQSHRMFVDGTEALPGAIPSFSFTELVMAPLVPYAPPIERGSSSQAPDGVYQVVAAMARRRFSRIARIVFAWRRIVGVERTQPAIVITGF